MLTALADAPRHGYAIVQEVLAISGGRTKLLTGTLYTALDRLLQQGLIRIDQEEVVAGRLRRTFALTEDGRGALAEETERLRAGVVEAERRLALGGLRPAADGRAGRRAARPGGPRIGLARIGLTGGAA